MARPYEKLFATFYDSIMSPVEKKLARRRQHLLSDLKGKVLDVGGGTGVNLNFYNDQTEILLIDPSNEMLEKAKVKFVNHASTQFLNYGINDNKLNEHIDQESLDAIVCTLVLCTIPNPGDAISNFKKWLKPSGKLVVLEHICSDHAFHASWQNAINPIWNIVGEGCNLNRKTDILIKSKGFDIVDQEEFFGSSIRFYQGVFSYS